MRPTPARRLYLPQLDALRFFAFTAVFFLHGLPAASPSTHTGARQVFSLLQITAQRAGANGVGLFFLLSAFLITELLLRERASTGDVHLGLFYVRRILRIWPLYFLILLIGWLLQPLAPDFRMPRWEVVSGLFFFLNWEFALRGWRWNPIFILWTISCEEQFYLLWPLLMKLLRRRWLPTACMAATVLVALAAYWSSSGSLPVGAAEFVWMFAYFPVGGLLALWVGSERPAKRLAWSVAMVILGLLLWLAGGLLTMPDGVQESTGLLLAAGRGVVMFGTVLLFLAFLRAEPRRLPPALVYLGKISYGLYVFHVMAQEGVMAAMTRGGLGLRTGRGSSVVNALLVFGVKLPVAMAVTIGLAAFSYRFLETPFLRLKDRFALVRSRAV